MKLSCNTWMFSSFPNWLPAYPIEYVIEKLASFGYEGIELGCASPVAYPPYLSKSRRAEIKKLLEDSNILVSSVLVCPGGGMGNNVSSPLPEEREQAIQSYKECIELGHDLGAGICLYVAGWQIWGVSTEQAFEWSRKALKEIAKFAQDFGVDIAVEPTPVDSNLIETADDAVSLMRSTGEKNIKLMFDTIHVLYRKEVITDYIDRMGSDLVHIHVSDLDRLPPGSRTDLRLMIAALKKNNYNGYLTMEIGLGGREVNPNIYALQAIEYMKSIL